MSFLGNDKFSTFLTAEWATSPADTTMSVNSVPANLPTIITAGFDTPLETVFSVTGSSGGNTLTGVTKLRGASVNLPQGTVIEVLDNEEFWNQYASAVFTQVGIKSLLYGVDGGSTDAYAITLLVAPASYSDITGVPIIFKANTVNTGEATLNVNGLGAKIIKKFGDDTLADGDIAAGQVVTVVYDGTDFQFQSSIQVDRDPLVNTVASHATPTINTDTTDMFTITALATAITSMTTNLTGTPVNGQKLIIRILDDGTARAITWGASFVNRGATLPTTTVLGKYHYIGLIWNSTTSTWDAVAAVVEA